MARNRKRRQLTREAATQSMIGTIIRLALIKASIGSGNELTRMGVVMQSVTVLEQFLRLILELDMVEKSRGRGRIAIRSIGGIMNAVALSEARLKASESGFQSERAVERMARWRGIPALLRFLDENGEDLRYLFEKRHALTHTAGIVEFDEVRAFAVVERLVRAVLGERPEYMLELLLVEGRYMSLAGRTADARRAYGEVIGACGRARAAGVGEERVQVCAGHALARLGRDGEAEGCY